jgi:hypothetical protein
MLKKTLVANLLFVILVCAFYFDSLTDARALPLTDRKTLVLYDAASESIPSSSLMAFTDFPPGSASLTYTDGATVLDTTISGTDTFAGWVSNPTTTAGFPILDRTSGVQINFTLQIDHETHANLNRAGLSVIILDKDAKGIEISFWEDQVWVQSDDTSGGLFTHGEGVTFTTTDMTNYQVTLAGDAYTLTANAEPLLTGPVHDYSRFSGFPDPYETPNFLFIGDDTTSCQSRVKLEFVSITGTESVMPATPMTSTGTVTPIDTPPSVPSATSTPFPTPAPAHPVFEFCPSSWLLGTVIIFNAILINKNCKPRTKHF